MSITLYAEDVNTIKQHLGRELKLLGYVEGSDTGTLYDAVAFLARSNLEESARKMGADIVVGVEHRTEQIGFFRDKIRTVCWGDAAEFVENDSE